MFRKEIGAMGAYKPPIEGRASKGFRLLDFNERTTPPPEHVRNALVDFADSGRLNVYPEYGDLGGMIASYVGLERGGSRHVMVSNGADQSIDIIFRSCLSRGDKVVIPTPSFGMFYVSADIQGAEAASPMYDENMQFPFEEFLSELKGAGLGVICSPNNPTGTLVPKDKIEHALQIVEGTPIMVDEVYSEFTGVSCADLVGKYPNLFVVRSFSKAWGLSGLRIGYTISQPQNIETLLKVRGPYDINMAARAGAMAALQDPAYMLEYVAEVMGKSKPLLEKYLREKGIKYHPGSANFVLIEVGDAKRAYELLKERNILVRPQKKTLSSKIRVSVGTVHDTQMFIEAFDDAIPKLQILSF